MLLGTAGGPLPSPVRAGIAQAVVVGGRTYLVDCGSGVTRQLRRARLLSSLHRVFVTHLHSDHVCDYFHLFWLGWPVLQWNPPVHVHGPGPAGGAGALPGDEAGRPPVPLVHPDDPTPGIVEITERLLQAHAYDVNIRMRESGRRDLSGLVVPHAVELPAGLGAAGPDRVAPEMEPVLVVEDDAVRVTATLVSHAPVFPAFAYRLDTDAGSVVVSGDTAPSPNLVRLARGADVLVHEVYDDGDDRDDVDVAATDEERHEAGRRHHHLTTSHTGLSHLGAVAAEAGVHRLVLTHFVPGDDVLPDDHWVKGVTGFDGEVVVGHDLLEIEL